MENQNNQNDRREGEPRISTRPGNFIVPGEGGAPKREGGGKRRRRGRRGHGHGHGQNAAKQPEVQNTPKAAAQPQEKKGNDGKGNPKKDRRDRLNALKGDDRTTIFHEAPHKLKATLADMCEIFGEERKISLCRELTKLNEDIMRTTLVDAVAYYNENSPRGEYVLVVEGAPEGYKAEGAIDLCSMSVEDHVKHYVDSGMTQKDAIKATAKDRGVPKNDIYMVFAKD